MPSLNRIKALGLIEGAGISQTPIDVEKIARFIGFIITTAPYPDSRKGSVHVEEGLKIIIVNTSHPIVVQRYTIAHELGHFVNGHGCREKTFSQQDDKRFYDPYFHQEKEADAFAAELLMPQSFLVQHLSQFGIDNHKLQELYQVSKRVVDIRLSTSRLNVKYAHIKNGS
jgi:Zn-dependent peptidase ImmA (M78 family)